MVGIVACAPQHGIRAGGTVKAVVAGVADQDIVERIAGGIDIRGADKGQVFDIRSQGICVGRVHNFRAFIDIFRHHITGIIHKVNIVPRSSSQRICTAGAVKNVVP